MRRNGWAIVMLVVATTAAGAWSLRLAGGMSTGHPTWTEVAWPFPMDEWGQGKAYRCGAADCGSEVDVYFRAKIGFCNCTTGVSDDAELERLSDFDLVGGRVDALAAGQPVRVGWMQGRSRPYRVAPPGPSGQEAYSVVFNHECDAMVALAVFDGRQRQEIERHADEFLNSDVVLQWARATLGLGPAPALSH
jgi:hypothetical protein